MISGIRGKVSSGPMPDLTEPRARRPAPGDPTVTRVLLLGIVLFSYFSIALMQMLLGLAFLNWSVGLRHRPREPVRAPLAGPMAAFVGISLLSALLIQNAHSIKESLSGGMPMLVYLVALNVMARPGWALRSARFVVAGGVLAAILGLVQAAFQEQNLRISGSLSHYMTFSGVVLVAVLVALGLLIFGSSARERGLVALGLVPMIGALLLTQTRGAWVGLAAGAAVLLALWRLRALPLLPIAAVLAYLIAPAHVQDRIRSTVDPNDGTVNERYVMWETGLSMVRAHPVLGVGPRMTQANYDAYRPADDPFTALPTPGHLHNNLVQTAAERGLLGLLLWLAIWVAWFFRVALLCRQLAPEERAARAVVVGSLAAMVAFQVMGLFEFNMGDSEVATLAMFVMALPFAVEGLREREQSAGEPAAAPPAAA